MYCGYRQQHTLLQHSCDLIASVKSQELTKKFTIFMNDRPFLNGLIISRAKLRWGGRGYGFITHQQRGGRCNGLTIHQQGGEIEFMDSSLIRNGGGRVYGLIANQQGDW